MANVSELLYDVTGSFRVHVSPLEEIIEIKAPNIQTSGKYLFFVYKLNHFAYRIIEPEALKQGNMSSLGFTSKEQRNLGLLVHLMTTNPKILYSPIGSQVDKVIQKASPFGLHHDLTLYVSAMYQLCIIILSLLIYRLWIKEGFMSRGYPHSL